MLKQLLTLIQFILPQHALTALAGLLAESRRPLIKNALIRRFMKTYTIDMSDALQEDPESYPSFNSFFTRTLKPSRRPIAAGDLTIISPVDGTIAQLGTIKQDQLIQAKGMYFDLANLLGGDKTLCADFKNGAYATLYLAPHNYHRVHMPIAGRLTKTIYIPGRLFSVNRLSSELIPSLYSRNERLICLFDTAAGPMALIFVGAFIVGSIQTVWMDKPTRHHHIQIESFADQPTLNKGAELGFFKLGSTVLMLFGEDRILWQPAQQPEMEVQYGQWVASFASD